MSTSIPGTDYNTLLTKIVMADDYTEFEEEHQFNGWLYNKFGSLRIVPESERNAICLLPMRDLDAKVYRDRLKTSPRQTLTMKLILCLFLGKTVAKNQK